MPSTPIAVRAGPSQPCPVCSSPSKGCSITVNAMHLCRGEPVVPSEWRRITKVLDSAGFHHYRNNITDPATGRNPSPSAPKRNRRATSADWAERARRYAADFQLRPQDRDWIAARLGLPPEVFSAIPLIGNNGASTLGPTITFPELDGAERIVGLSERVPGESTDEKRIISGGHRGLTIPDGWRDRPGPVFVPEGASDTLAMTAAGTAAVGRPGADIGVDQLARLLRDLPPDRPIIIVGENDRKPPGSVPEWPGRDGCIRVAAALAAELKRPVRAAMPPPPAKDARAWLTHPDRSGTEWAERGRVLSSLLSAPTAAPPAPVVPLRRRIVAGFDEYDVNTSAITALADHPGTFTRGGKLVGVAWQAADDRLHNCAVHVPAGPKITLLSKPTLRERLTVVADWWSHKDDVSGGKVSSQARPPNWCTAAVLDRGNWPGISPLVAIAEFPVFLPDGSILSKPGYDPSSGLYYFPAVPVTVSVPAAPTANDVTAALAVLDSAVCDFPFVTEHHRSAWLAGLLTPLARFAFAGPSPLFLVEANVPGAGKGLLVNTANLIVRGDSSAVLEFSRDAEELQKVLTALLIQGESIATFDNVEGTLGGGVLNKLLTADLWEGRILGTSSTVRVPNLCTWWCTGNNVAVIGDTARRVCGIRLESPLENPEERTDLRHDDLPAWTREHRPELLSAALTILRAYHTAGRPRQEMRSWGSYVQWSALVRGAIVWAGWPDPLGDGTSVRQEDDPIRGAIRVLIERWTDIDPDRTGLTTARVIAKIDELGSLGSDDLKEALEILSPKSHKQRVSALGYRFRENLRRTMGRYRLDKKPVKRGLIYWYVSDLSSTLYSSDSGDTESGGHGVDGGHHLPPTHARSHAHTRTHAGASTLAGGEPCPPSQPCPPSNHATGNNGDTIVRDLPGGGFEIDLSEFVGGTP